MPKYVGASYESSSPRHPWPRRRTMSTTFASKVRAAGLWPQQTRS